MNETYDDVVRTRHAAVRSVLERSNPAVLDSKLIGSLQRKTRIQPRPDDEFDIDVLIILGEFTGWVAVGGISPAQALENVHCSVKESDRYSTKNPQQDAPTVSLEFADRIKVELVPAYIDSIGRTSDGTPVPPVGRGYWIPKDGRWEHADYDFEADYISSQNAASGGWLVPAIKMLKAIRREYFPGLRSFPLEILAAQIIPIIVNARKTHGLQISSPDLLEAFFAVAKETLGTSLMIPGSNSPAVLVDSVAVGTIKSSFDTLERYIHLINESTTDAAKVEGWRKIFGDAFPTRI